MIYFSVTVAGFIVCLGSFYWYCRSQLFNVIAWSQCQLSSGCWTDDDEYAQMNLWSTHWLCRVKVRRLQNKCGAAHYCQTSPIPRSLSKWHCSRRLVTACCAATLSSVKTKIKKILLQAKNKPSLFSLIVNFNISQIKLMFMGFFSLTVSLCIKWPNLLVNSLGCLLPRRLATVQNVFHLEVMPLAVGW